MTQNRKRGRNMREDETEFMPLSKRINNLHINNGLLLESAATSNGEWGPGPPYLAQPNVAMPESPPESVRSVEWPSTAGQSPYSPELSEAQNPYYFNVNKLLYEMYLARMSRTNGHQ